MNMGAQNQANSDMEGNDDDNQPSKPIIEYEHVRQDGSMPMLPEVDTRNRQMGVLGNKKGSVNIVSENRLLNENDS